MCGLLLVAAGALGAICGESEPTTTPGVPTPLPAPTVSAARVAEAAATVASFDEFPLVWLGDSYDSDGDGIGDVRISSEHAAHAIARVDPHSGKELSPVITSFTFGYGTCDIPPLANSCPIPINIDVYASNDALPSLSGVEGHVTVRGVDAAIFDRGNLWIVTADFTVSISPSFAKDGDDKLNKSLRIANQLYGANAKAAGVTKTATFVLCRAAPCHQRQVPASPRPQ
jgi:hypothetical protein